MESPSVWLQKLQKVLLLYFTLRYHRSFYMTNSALNKNANDKSKRNTSLSCVARYITVQYSYFMNGISLLWSVFLDVRRRGCVCTCAAVQHSTLDPCRQRSGRDKQFLVFPVTNRMRVMAANVSDGADCPRLVDEEEKNMTLLYLHCRHSRRSISLSRHRNKNGSVSCFVVRNT